MPVAAAYMVYAGATMATVTTFGALMAGAMVVGGAYSLVGTLTGNEYMEKDGMILGSLASLGSAAAGSGAAAGGTESAAGADLTATGTTPGATETLTGSAVNAGVSGTTAGTTGGIASPQYLELSNRFNSLQAANESAQTMNLVGNVGQGISQAYTAQQQRQQQEDMYNQTREDRLAEEERLRQNMNLTGLTIETPAMPSILPKPKPPVGLINQQPQPGYNPVTGSGITTMQLQPNRAR